MKKVKEENFSIQKQKLKIENNVLNTKSYYKKRFLPSVEFEAEGDISNFDDKGVGPEKIGLKIDLDIGRKGLNEYKVRKNNLKITELEKGRLEAKLEEDIIFIYFDYLSTKKRILYMEETQKVLTKYQEKLYKMLREGNLIPKNELLKIEIEIENNKLEIIKNSYKKRTLKQKLCLLMGLELDQNITFEEVPLYTLTNLEELNLLEKNGLKESLSSKIIKLELENSIYEEKISKANLLPEVYIKPEYLFEDKGYEKKGGKLMVGFNWKFEWGNTLNDIEVSSNNLEIAKMEYKEKMGDFTLAIREKIEEFKMGKIILEISSKKLILMQENLKLDTSRFENGLLSSSEYLKSVNSLKESEGKYYEQQQKIFLLNISLRNLIS